MTVYMLQYVFWFCVCRELCRVRLRLSPHKDDYISGRALCVFMFFLYIALITMLRHRTIGTDTNSYTGSFERLAHGVGEGLSFSFEDVKAPVFLAIEYFLAMISDHPQIYIASFSLIVATGFAIYIYRSSDNVSFSCFVYVGMGTFYFSMNGMRQATAMAISLNAYLDLRKNPKSLRGWLLYAVALGIHPTCIFLLPSIFFSRMAVKTSVKKVTVIAIVSAVLAGAFISYGIDLFTAIFPAYGGYGGSEGVAARALQRGRIIVYYAFLGGLSFLYALRSWHSKTSEPEYPNAVFGAVMGMLFYRDELLKRMVSYFICSYITFIPKVFNRYPKGERMLLYIGCFIALFIYATWNLIENKSTIVPYRMFFM